MVCQGDHPRTQCCWLCACSWLRCEDILALYQSRQSKDGRQKLMSSAFGLGSWVGRLLPTGASPPPRSPFKIPLGNSTSNLFFASFYVTVIATFAWPLPVMLGAEVAAGAMTGKGRTGQNPRGEPGGGAACGTVYRLAEEWGSVSTEATTTGVPRWAWSVWAAFPWLIAISSIWELPTNANASPAGASA